MSKENENLRSKQTGLTPVQEKAVALMIDGADMEEVAKQCQIEVNVLLGWQNTLVFQCYLNQKKSFIKSVIKSGCISMYAEALKTLRDCLQSNNESIKLKSATLILQMIDNIPVGNTDVRAQLKEQCKINEDWMGNPMYDEKKYQKLLNENGLSVE